MLARKAVGWEAQRTSTYRETGVLRKPGSRLFELTPVLRMILSFVAFCTLIVVFVQGSNYYITNCSYKVVGLQNEVVQLSRANDELNLEVSELKSPTRIQKIAQEKLGMVLPDGFVYSSRGTIEEQEVTAAKRIVD